MDRLEDNQVTLQNHFSQSLNDLNMKCGQLWEQCQTENINSAAQIQQQFSNLKKEGQQIEIKY